MTAADLHNVDVLLPYQKAWVADDADVKVCEKSRRVGLSWGEASDATLTAASSREAGGMNVWYVGYNKDMAQEFINDCAFWARHFDMAAGEIQEEIFVDGPDKHIQTFVIRFASGFRVTALSSRPSNLRGKQGLVIIDEAAFHDDLDGLIKAAMALLMWGGKVRIISTHNGDNSAFNELVQAIRAGKLPYSLHRITFDDAVGQGLYQRICLATGVTWSPRAEAQWVRGMRERYGEHAGEELDVIPSQGAGRYLTRALAERVTDRDVPVIRLRREQSFAEWPTHMREADIRAWCEQALHPWLAALEPTLHSYFGEDFARTGDLTAIWPAQRRRTLELHVPFVVELSNIPFEQQRQILFYIVDRLPRFAAGAMDARGNGQYLAEVAMQKYGASRIEQVMLSTQWYREHMPRFKAAFEDNTHNIPADVDVVEDMLMVRMDKGIAKVPEDARRRGGDGLERHGDSAVALALLHYAAAVMEPADIEWTDVPDKAQRWDRAPHEDDDINIEGVGAW